MPAVKHRTDNDVTQRAEGPAQVGVDEKIIEADHQSSQRQHRRIKAEHQAADEEQSFSGGFDDVFRRMKTHRREPVHFFRTVMDGMERPDGARMKDAVAEINQAIACEQERQQLSGKQQRRDLRVRGPWP